LVSYFIHKKARQLKISVLPDLAPGVMNRLVEYAWPGNVRELENVIEREMILDRKGPLKFVNFSMKEKGPVPSSAKSGSNGGCLSLEAINIQHITRALALTGGKIYGPDGAAALLGINPNTLRSRMKRLGIMNTKKQTKEGSTPARIYLVNNARHGAS
jgi:transcriptional regulator with GAF, ATPase, and Fis domain